MQEGIGLARAWRPRALMADPTNALRGPRWALGLLLGALVLGVATALQPALAPGEREMLIVARVMVATSVLVAIVGLLQIERVFAIHEWLATYYSAGQVREALEHRRATSTLGVWQALGAYLAVHAALAAA